jgi:SAM-dependent methyltransferase
LSDLHLINYFEPDEIPSVFRNLIPRVGPKMLLIKNLKNKNLVKTAWKKVLGHMKEMGNFIPDRNWILYLLLPDKQAGILDIGPNVYLFKTLLEPEKFSLYSYTAMDTVGRYDDSAVHQILHDASTGPYPFPDASFDIIIASDVIEHLSDTDVFLKEVFRLLKPDGQFFCTTPNYASLFCIVKVLRGKMFHNPLGKEVEQYCYREHCKYFTHKDLVPYLRHFGLKVNVIVTHDLKTDINYALTNGLRGRIAVWFFNLFSRIHFRFSPEIVLIASKKSAGLEIIRV